MSKSSAKQKKSTDPLDTPVMRQYLELKDQYQDAILLFRMGDFYELFLEDAQIAAPLMDITLTKRQSDIPMAGVPYHSADTYIGRLLAAGQKVAIAEQEADPDNPKLMRRRVRRVLTPGTLVEESFLRGASHNYLLAIAPLDDGAGIALADTSTGDFFTLELLPDESQRSDREDEPAFAPQLRDLIYRYRPIEVIAPSRALPVLRTLFDGSDHATTLSPMEDWMASALEGARKIDHHYKQKLSGLGYEDSESPALAAVALILHYVARNFPDSDFQLRAPVFRETSGRTMVLDEQTIRNLDLIENQGEGGRARSLFGVLDHCRTAVGKRFLKESILAPLLDAQDIRQRQNYVQGFARDRDLSAALQLELKSIGDLDRVLTRHMANRGVPRDFRAFVETVRSGKRMYELLHASGHSGAMAQPEPALVRLADELDRSIVSDPPSLLGNGQLLSEGVDKELDRARAATERGARWIIEFETEEKDRTGITALRVKYNRVNGYFIEVSRGQADRVPEDYRRKQTLTGYERFTCERLAELEQSILEADDTISRIEQEYFHKYSRAMLELRDEVRTLMEGVAFVDFILALSEPVARGNWVCPELVSENQVLAIEGGRHPVVEHFLAGSDDFIANEVDLREEERQFAIITGPNMAGKSTYIRQVALIQLLAQIGAFVPARAARISVVDRIFTRIGAQDNLTRGESTFFVEMVETARILNQCTGRSLVVMDEVGRGTSTYDGMSLAWSIVEYLSGEGPERPLTLFATHYHELTALAERDGVFNLTMDVREVDGRVVFLHRVVEGAANRSYGIHVARLAGLPASVTERAAQKLLELEEDDSRRKNDVIQKRHRKREERQNLLFE